MSDTVQPLFHLPHGVPIVAQCRDLLVDGPVSFYKGEIGIFVHVAE